MDVRVDWVMTDSGSVMENADFAITNGVFVLEMAVFDMSVVDFNVDEHFAPDNSMFLVPLTTAEYESLG